MEELQDIQEPTDNVYREVSARVEEWFMLHQQEVFFFEDIVKFYDWRERVTKEALSKKLYYESTKPKPRLEKRGRGYRLIDRLLVEAKWWEANGKPYPIKLPFELEKYAVVDPHSLIVIAGTWGDGKTAVAYNVVFLNMYDLSVTLFNSEMSDASVRRRVEDYANYIPKPPPFKTYYRTENFADVIDPDGLNVIDYLTVDSDKQYLVRDELKRILDKLDNGVAVVALQKPVGRDIAYGGNPTAWDTCLYVSLESNKMKIVKVRTPADPKVNPKNMTLSFKLSKGINFYDVHTTYE